MVKVMRWLRNNECPICQGRLVLITKDTAYYDVDDEGHIEPYFATFDSFYDERLVCPKCNKYFPAKVEGDKVSRITKPILDKQEKKESNPFYKEMN